MANVWDTGLINQAYWGPGGIQGLGNDPENKYDSYRMYSKDDYGKAGNNAWEYRNFQNDQAVNSFNQLRPGDYTIPESAEPTLNNLMTSSGNYGAQAGKTDNFWRAWSDGKRGDKLAGDYKSWDSFDSWNSMYGDWGKLFSDYAQGYDVTNPPDKTQHSWWNMLQDAGGMRNLYDEQIGVDRNSEEGKFRYWEFLNQNNPSLLNSWMARDEAAAAQYDPSWITTNTAYTDLDDFVNRAMSDPSFDFFGSMKDNSDFKNWMSSMLNQFREYKMGGGADTGYNWMMDQFGNPAFNSKYMPSKPAPEPVYEEPAPAPTSSGGGGGGSTTYTPSQQWEMAKSSLPPGATTEQIAEASKSISANDPRSPYYGSPLVQSYVK